MVMVTIIIIIIIMYCKDNLNWKYRSLISAKLSGPPGDPDYQSPYYGRNNVLNRTLWRAVCGQGLWGGGGRHVVQGLLLREICTTWVKERGFGNRGRDYEPL